MRLHVNPRNDICILSTAVGYLFGNVHNTQGGVPPENVIVPLPRCAINVLVCATQVNDLCCLN